MVLSVLTGIWGCVQRSENEVVLYVSADREFAAPILDKFEREREIKIARQFDIESTKTVGLVTRILEEEKRPRCDVFWNNEILHTIRLQKSGALLVRRWKIPDEWPKHLRASDGTWVGFAARARVLLINLDRLPTPEEWPKEVRELADERWKGKCGLAYPLYGTTATHFAILGSNKAIDEVESWFSKVAANAVVLSGNKQVAQAVASGELAWGLTDTDDALVEKELGRKVAMIFPDQGIDGIGALLIPNTISVIRNSPHPIAATRLADYLISQPTEERLTMGNGAQFPLWPNGKNRSERQNGAEIRWMESNFEEAADGWNKISEKLQEVFQR